MNETSHVVVTTTSESEDLAIKLAGQITSARLAACVQFWPIRSVYWWQGKMESGAEFILQCKTRASLAPALRDFIRAHHPYEVPEIIVTPILDAAPSYLAWIDQETSRHD
jgi:periplasmic divalent cation tolerance protein